jgi:hypothetical protein
VLPKLTLDDFDGRSNRPYRIYRLQYSLPQHGTEISVKVVEDGETDSGDWGAYIRYLESLPMRKLRWDRANGVFKLAKAE